MKSVGAAKIQVNIGLLYRAGIRVHVSIFLQLVSGTRLLGGITGSRR